MQKISIFILAVISGTILTSGTAAAITTEATHAGLVTHNQLRKLHGAPALQWDDELANMAAKHAARCQFKHSSYRYGENLATGFPTPAAAIKAWYGESSDYSYRRPRFSSRTGHFTQLVWKSTTKLGCAVAACNGKNGTPGDFLVCEYSPAGNINSPEYFSANVTPAKA